MGLWTLLAPLLLGTLAEEAQERRFCVVGAGPSGLQFGHFLFHAGRDYVIFERNNVAGSFFSKYPRHRGLISLNKRNVREGRSSEFAMRHDWNSLLDVRGENATRPVTERSKLLFPRADVVVDYLKDFAEEQAQHIEYGVIVRKLRRRDDGGFEIDLFRKQSDERFTERCQEVVWAGGLWNPRGAASTVDGSKLIEGYENLPETGEQYEGKSVVILGLGNAALETAQELQKYTSEVHVYARARPLPEGGKGVRIAHQTHYVGDIRAGRTTILDTYLLKSLDTFDFDALSANKRLAVFPCNGTRRCLWEVNQDDCVDEHCRENFYKSGQDLDYRLHVADFQSGSKTLAEVRKLMSQFDAEGWELSVVEEEPEPPEKDREDLESKTRLGIDRRVFATQFTELTVSAVLMRREPELMEQLWPLRAKHTNGNTRFPMDHVIRCYGWVMDPAVFDASVPVNLTHGGKYPEIHGNYEAVGVPGLYFAGTVSHSLDFRKSAGGFIHGFRYTARALFRLLEEKSFDIPWPQRSVPLGSPRALAEKAGGLAKAVKPVFRLIQDRINNAAGPYQMFQALGDMVLFENSTAGWTARFLEEVPLAYFHERYQNTPRLTWEFKYNEHFYGPKVFAPGRVGCTSADCAEKSNFLHPHVRFFNASSANSSEPSMRHWMAEDIFTQWTEDRHAVPLWRFVARVVAHLTDAEEVSWTGAGFEEMDDADDDSCVGGAS